MDATQILKSRMFPFRETILNYTLLEVRNMNESIQEGIWRRDLEDKGRSRDRLVGTVNSDGHVVIYKIQFGG